MVEVCTVVIESRSESVGALEVVTEMVDNNVTEKKKGDGVPLIETEIDAVGPPTPDVVVGDTETAGETEAPK